MISCKQIISMALLALAIPSTGKAFMAYESKCGFPTSLKETAQCPRIVSYDDLESIKVLNADIAKMGIALDPQMIANITFFEPNDDQTRNVGIFFKISRVKVETPDGQLRSLKPADILLTVDLK